MRFLGDQFYTLLTVGGLVVLFSGWAILNVVSAQREVPGPLYIYFIVGIGLCALCGAVYLLRQGELRTVWERRRAMKEAKLLLREARRGRERYKGRLSEKQSEELGQLSGALEEARDRGDWERLGAALAALDKKLDEHLAFARKSTVREYVESIGIAIAIALLLRAFVVEAFRIPSGSMIPTLQVGDHIFVNKFLYGVRLPWTDYKFGMDLRKPHRGEVIVFKFPKDPDKDFIKRIVAVEGDAVEIRQNVPWINGQPVKHLHRDGPCEYEDKADENTEHWEHRICEAYTESLDGREFSVIYDHGGAERSWPEVKVPPGHVFVMGDNRDNSHDSRYWGFVPFELIKGKAMIIWWSWGQPEGIRVGRMGHLVE